uniref:Uncharacterized protein n=1 Tax=Arundo donax TaxID=35708 RepID=A0A0A9AGW2_ARUDO
MAEKLKSSTSSTRSYPNRDPASTATNHFPRSRYPIEIRSVGPRVRKRLCRASPAAGDSMLCTPLSLTPNCLPNPGPLHSL